MGAKDSTAVMRHIRALFGGGAAGGASDGQLLERFRKRGGDPDAEAAFAVLVARHGPMVLGVCRRALRDPDDAADAFQATFLVLVRKADSVRVEDSLGRWLYGVSRRVAARARVEAARRAAPPAKAPGRGRSRRCRETTWNAGNCSRHSMRRSSGCPSPSALRSCSATSRA